MSANSTVLSPAHLALIQSSAIDPAVAVERGYRTVTSKAELKRLEFSEAQRLVPALLIPIYGVTGDLVMHQIRPDNPRIVRGKPLKYETPKGSRLALDVPRRARAWLGDPKRSLFVTEGARKADSAVSKSLCTVAIPGVWGFRGTNEYGGKTALADWESVAPNGRDVYIVFDSDVMQKPGVALALRRLKPLLESRLATVRVVYLPPGDGGTKVGLDDFFAAGGTVEKLLALSEAELRPMPDDERAGSPYFVEAGSTYWRKPMGGNLVDTRLANFGATIVAEVTFDDGVEPRPEYEVEVRLGDRVVHGTIPVRSFPSLNWVGDLLGARAIVSPGQGLHDHLRAAIQTLSSDIASRVVFTHSGWRRIEGHGWVYLHSGGALGPLGPVSEIEVDLPEPLRPLHLPAPPVGAECARVIRESLGLVELAPASIAFPLLAAINRAALGNTDFSLWLAGMSGLYKTELAALVQSHFGSQFSSRNLPGNWSSTANSNETLAFFCKDAPFVIDDFSPQGSRQDVQRLYRDADRILRAQGNHTGRGRLRADASMRASKPPRGMVVATGEDVPPGLSMQARTFVIEIAKGDVSLPKLTACQQRAAAGDYASAMSAFIGWAAPRLDELRVGLNAQAKLLRGQAQADGRHARTASIVGELQAGFEVFLEFAEHFSAIDPAKAKSLRQQSWTALLKVAEAQSRQHLTTEPATVFVRLLSSALSSGKAHIADRDGAVPPTDLLPALGWKPIGSEIRPLGPCVGWFDGKDVYLDPDAALNAAQGVADDSSRISISVNRLSKHLLERGYLVSTDRENSHVAVRRWLQGQRRRVLHLALSRFAEAVPPVPDEKNESEEAGGGAVDGTSCVQEASESGPTHRSQPSPGSGSPATAGPLGPDSSAAAVPPQTAVDLESEWGDE